jgi:hypothetical protein
MALSLAEAYRFYEWCGWDEVDDWVIYQISVRRLSA